MLNNNNNVIESLQDTFAEEPLFKLFGYLVKYNHISIRSLSNLSSLASTSINQVRKEEGGRFRVDKIIKETTKSAVINLDMIEDAEVEELNDSYHLFYPNINKRSL